ncbi:hypothetical protein J4Q44_G00157250 [Coregonus suidteri]|uniref:Uncharacterized protein n=1 Tax=Coregonus suidteri TaxID=861788 RepID=A0AAN8M8M1_9TELE
MNQGAGEPRCGWPWALWLLSFRGPLLRAGVSGPARQRRSGQASRGKGRRDGLSSPLASCSSAARSSKSIWRREASRGRPALPRAPEPRDPALPALSPPPPPLLPGPEPATVWSTSVRP